MRSWIFLFAMGVFWTGEGGMVMARPPHGSLEQWLSAGRVVRELRQEAADPWFKRRQFPRDEQIDPEAHHLRVRRTDLIQTLGERQHPAPDFDAYLRWHLLGFQPDLAGLPRGQYRALIRSMPRLPRPEPAGQAGEEDGPRSDGSGTATDPRAGVVNQGSHLDVSGRVNPHDPRRVRLNARASATDAVAVKQAAEAMREAPQWPDEPADPQWVLRYHESLIRRLPRANGVRLRARMADLADRLAANHPGIRAAGLEVLEESRRLAQGIAVDTRARQAVHTQLERLEQAMQSAQKRAKRRGRIRLPGDLLQRVEAMVRLAPGGSPERSVADSPDKQGP